MTDLDVFAIDRVDALFDGALDDFVARRDALVKELKADKRKDEAAAVKALRKPSAAAWAINTVARSSRDDVDALLRAGAFVRDAQAAAMQGRDDGSLRTTTREWRELLNGLAARAGAHRDDAMVAFEAASTDETVAAVVGAGHLIAVPEAGGLGGLAGMPEPIVREREPEREPDPVPTPEPEPVTETAPERADSRSQLAEKEIERLTLQLRRAEQRLDQAKQAVRDAEDALEEARRQRVRDAR